MEGCCVCDTTELRGRPLITESTTAPRETEVELSVLEELVLTESESGPKLFGLEGSLNMVVGSDNDGIVVEVADVGYRTSAIGPHEDGKQVSATELTSRCCHPFVKL